MKILCKFVKCNLKNRMRSNYKGLIIFRKYSGHGSMKVTVIGAAGKVGQPLCLLLKKSPLIDELSVHDVNSTSDLGKELNPIDTKCKVTTFSGTDKLKLALKDSKIVAVLASAPDIDYLALDKMWQPNSIIIKNIMLEISHTCPKALVAIGTNPINSIVPMACEILRKGGFYNSNGVFGITTLDTVRANTLVAQVQGLQPECVMVPVIGGHSPETTIPVLSQTKPCADFTNDEIEDLTLNIRYSHNKLPKTEENGPMGAFVTAFASARFIISLVKAVQGSQDIVECAYVSSRVHPFLKFLATPLVLGPNGIAKNLGLPELSDFEQTMFNNAVPILANEIQKGEKFTLVDGLSPRDGSSGSPHVNSPKVASSKNILPKGVASPKEAGYNYSRKFIG